MTKKHTYPIIIILVVVCLISYSRILGNDFINFDDNVYLTENNHVRSGLNLETVQWAFTAVVSSNWHPLTLLSHALDWSMFGDKAGGHHFVNLLLHIAGVLLLFLFLNKTTKSLWPSAFIAALFALHPLRVESVAWAAERKDVLSMAFGLATIYAYSFYAEKQQTSQYILCLVLFALGLMAKPMLVTLPFLLLLLDYWPLERWKKENSPLIVTNESKIISLKKKDRRLKSQPVKQTIPVSTKDQPTISRLFWEKTPFFLLAIISSAITVWAQNKGGALAPLDRLPFFERLMNAVVSYAAYLGKIFWPVDLAVFYPYRYNLSSGEFLLSAILIIAISIVVILYIRKLPFLFVGWFWYLGTLVPVIGLVQVGRQAMADRYTYLPSIGIGIMIVWGLMSLLPKEKLQKIILIPLAAITIILLAVITWRQCGYWKNSIELFRHALNVTENNYLAHDSLGVALDATGKHQEAILHYRSSIKINPDQANAYYNLASALKDQGNMEEAVKYLRETLRINSSYRNAHNKLGIILEKYFRNYDEAIYNYQQELEIQPDEAGVHYNLGIALAKKGMLKDAEQHFYRAISLNPDNNIAREALRITQEMIQKN
jgi:protein O-mannosyl-transferase